MTPTRPPARRPTTPVRTPPRPRALALGLALAVLACGGGGRGTAAGPPPAPEPSRTVPLGTAGLAGQAVSVLPITLVVPQPALEGDSSLADRARTLRWVDSLIGAALVSRAPDVKWVLPPELRRIARRAPTLADPDHLGQSVMRAPGLRQLPEPLHSNLRGLVALAGGRYAFIPAALGLSRDGAGIVKAELAVVMADARRGDVPWRTVASGTGPTPREAVRAALASMLPLGSGAP